MDPTALSLTLKLATATTLILLITGLPLAWWLATTQWRGRALVEALVTLPMILPPTVLGFYLLIATGPDSTLGGLWAKMMGGTLPFRFEGILLASVVFNLPFVLRPFVAGFSGVDRRLLEASWCLGVSKLGTFFRIALPLAWTGVISGIVLGFAHTVGEFGVVLMMGGNIPGETQTLSIQIYDDVQAMRYDQAGHTAAWLLLFSFICLCIVSTVQKRPLST